MAKKKTETTVQDVTKDETMNPDFSELSIRNPKDKKESDEIEEIEEILGDFSFEKMNIRPTRSVKSLRMLNPDNCVQWAEENNIENLLLVTFVDKSAADVLLQNAYYGIKKIGDNDNIHIMYINSKLMPITSAYDDVQKTIMNMNRFKLAQAFRYLLNHGFETDNLTIAVINNNTVRYEDSGAIESLFWYATILGFDNDGSISVLVDYAQPERYNKIGTIADLKPKKKKKDKKKKKKDKKMKG